MRRHLKNARVLITGASSGIGREIARAAGRRGARLLLTSRREPELNALATECLRAGAPAAAIVAGDIAEPGARAAVAARAQQEFAGLDVLFNNAGTSAHGRFADSDEATLRRIMEVNFFAPAELARVLLPLLREPGQPGRAAPAIVNVASIIAHRGLPLNSEYAASKFALRGWSESLRAELARDGIDVLLVSPGTTDTEFFDHLLARRASLPWQGSAAISAAAVAEQTLRALERGRREIFPNWRGRAMVIANRLAPALVDRIVTRMAGPAGNPPQAPDA
ncbi:MAG TPA: SDR family NAD(P)-dependent oxidoreductase [Lacipirellulaceae bacterium]|nr:SDR family NAD(P)-dependent oxidoreductase [Lacipirellulaceae bacterium]